MQNFQMKTRLGGFVLNRNVRHQMLAILKQLKSYYVRFIIERLTIKPGIKLFSENGKLISIFILFLLSFVEKFNYFLN